MFIISFLYLNLAREKIASLLFLIYIFPSITRTFGPSCFFFLDTIGPSCYWKHPLVRHTPTSQASIFGQQIWTHSDKSPQLWHLPRKLLNFSTRLMTLLSQTVLRSRPMITYFTALIKGLVFSNYGSYWRLMKKLSVQHLLSASNQELVGHVRREEIRMMVKSWENAAKMGEIVDIIEKVQGLLEDIVYKIVLGCNKDDQFDMKGLISEGLRLARAFNFADIVPW